MDLLPDETVIWQGRPSWRSHIAWFLLWIPLALVPAIIAGALKKSGRDPWGGYWKWILLSLALVLLVVGYDALRRRATEYTVTDKRLQIDENDLWIAALVRQHDFARDHPRRTL